MKTGKLLKKWMVAFVAAILTISLFAIPAFAHAEGDGHDHPTPETTAPVEETGLSTDAIIGLIIAGVVLVALIVLGIKFREKIRKFFRVYKSESKKVVWLTWGQTLKNSYVVIVIIAIGAVVLCALDFGLNAGLRAFIDLFNTPAA